MQSYQILIKPVHRLQESLLLGKLLNLLTRITPHRKSMNDSTIQIDLIWLLRLNHDFLGLVAFLSREDLVGFCGCDRERSLDGSQLGFLDEGRVRNEADIDALSLHKTNGVFCSLFPSQNPTLIDSYTEEEKRRAYKAVAHTPNLLITLLPQIRNTLFDNGIHLLRRVRVVPTRPLRQPSHEIKTLMPVQRHRITVKQIWHQSIIPISGELVGHELGVLPDANHIGQVEDRGVFVDCLFGRRGYVGFDAADFNEFAGGFTTVFC